LIPCLSSIDTLFFLLSASWLIATVFTICHAFVGTYVSATASALHDVQHILVKDFMYALKVGAYFHPCSTTHQFKLLLL
jgi:hypothetical protein